MKTPQEQLEKGAPTFWRMARPLLYVLLMFGIVPAAQGLAIDYPLTSAQIHKAIAEGSNTTMADLGNDRRFNKTTDTNTWVNFAPECRIMTPYLYLILEAMTAKQKYEPIPAAFISGMKKSHDLHVEFWNFSPELNANANAVGVIHQNGRIIKAVDRTFDDQHVETVGDSTGYLQWIDFTFDLRKFDPHQPFSVGLANVFIQTTQSPGETQCVVDGSTP